MKKNFIDLTNLFKELNKKNVTYCVLRNFDDLPRVYLGQDVDLYVSIDHKNLFFEILLNFAKKNKLINSKNYFTEYSSHYRFGSQIANFLFLPIDAIYEYKWNGITIIETDTIKKNIINYKKIKVLNKNISVAITLIKKILFNQEHDKVKLIRDLKSFAKDNTDNLFFDKYCKNFFSYIKKNTFHKQRDGFFYFYYIRGALIFFIVSNKFFLFPFFSFIFAQINKIKYYSSRNTSAFVVFLGPDGSGKSTVISKISKYFQYFFRKKTFNYHTKISGKNQDAVANPYSKKQYQYPLSILKLFYFLAHYYFTYLFCIKLKLSRSSSGLIIFDRFYYDLATDPRRLRMKNHKILEKLFRFLPKPDMVVILIGDPNEISSRKNEISPNDVKKQVISLKRLPRILNLHNFLFINTSLNNVDQTCNLIINKLFKNE